MTEIARELGVLVALNQLYARFDLGLGEKRAMQTVLMVERKFSPSHTLFIH
jgi:hypothetical protein